MDNFDIHDIMGRNSLSEETWDKLLGKGKKVEIDLSVERLVLKIMGIFMIKDRADALVEVSSLVKGFVNEKLDDIYNQLEEKMEVDEDIKNIIFKGKL